MCLQNDLKWNNYIYNILRKSWQKDLFLKGLWESLPKEIGLTTYLTKIRSRIDPRLWETLCRRTCTLGFHKSHNTAQFGGLFALKQWISSSLKHDTVPRVNDLYCFYERAPQKVLHFRNRKVANSQNLAI